MTAPSEPVEQAAAWSARYAEYLAASSRRASRNAELTRQLMRRLARGEVSPTVVETAHLAFLSGTASRTADELADATVQFLAGLVSAEDRQAWELVDAVAPGLAPPPDEAAPGFGPGAWTGWLQQLTDHAAQRRNIRVQTLRSLLDRVAAGEIDPGQVQPAAAEAVAAGRAPAAIGAVVELYFTLLDRLDAIHAEYTTGYLENVLGLVGGPTPAGETLHLVAPLGGTASVRFAVVNSGAEDTPVRSVLTDVRRADGVGPAFDLDATVTPDSFVLRTGSEDVLTLSVRLWAHQFTVGPEYEGNLRVLGPAGSLVELPLRLRAADAPAQKTDHP